MSCLNNLMWHHKQLREPWQRIDSPRAILLSSNFLYPTGAVFAQYRVGRLDGVQQRWLWVWLQPPPPPPPSSGQQRFYKLHPIHLFYIQSRICRKASISFVQTCQLTRRRGCWILACKWHLYCLVLFPSACIINLNSLFVYYLFC